jgi:hypothetical protein
MRSRFHSVELQYYERSFIHLSMNGLEEEVERNRQSLIHPSAQLTAAQ